VGKAGGFFNRAECESGCDNVPQKRPPHVKPPAYLSPNTPVPEPELVVMEPESGREGPDPTRYGDWEKKGIAVDF
jgi:hypothetical protein